MINSSVRVCVSVLTHLLLNHKSASLLFASYPLDSFSTSHHSNFPVTQASSFFHFHIWFMCFPSLASLHSSQLHSAMLESIVLVHLFCDCCHQVKQIQKWINFPLQPLRSQNALLCCPCGPQTVLREPLCGQQCCVAHRIVTLTCRVHLLIKWRIWTLQDIHPLKTLHMLWKK